MISVLKLALSKVLPDLSRYERPAFTCRFIQDLCVFGSNKKNATSLSELLISFCRSGKLIKCQQSVNVTVSEPRVQK